MTGPQQPYGYGQPPPYPPPRRRGTPAWVVVLLSVGGIVVLLLVLATCAAIVGAAGDDDQATTPRVVASGAPTSTATDAPAGEVPAPGPELPSGPLQHPEDVEILACGPDERLGWGRAEIRITNNSSEPSTYVIKIAFESPDGTVLHAEGIAAVTSLAPGQTTVETPSALDEIPVDTVCRLTSAQRTAA